MAISNNPFVPLIMQGVHMLAEDARQQRREFREEQRYQARRDVEIQRQEEKDRFNQKLNFISQQSRNDALTPESQKALTDLGFEMLKDPNADLSGLDLQVRPPKQEKTDPLYGIDPRYSKFYRLPQDKVYTLGEAIDIAKSYQDDLRLAEERAKGGGGAGTKKDIEKDPLKYLNTLEETARDRYNKGIAGLTYDTMGGERQVFRPIDENAYQIYLKKIDSLRKKFKEGNWTENDQQELDRIATFDIFEKQVGAINKAIESQGMPQPMPSHKRSKTDRLNLRQYVE